MHDTVSFQVVLVLLVLLVVSSTCVSTTFQYVCMLFSVRSPYSFAWIDYLIYYLPYTFGSVLARLAWKNGTALSFHDQLLSSCQSQKPVQHEVELYQHTYLVALNSMIMSCCYITRTTYD